MRHSTSLEQKQPVQTIKPEMIAPQEGLLTVAEVARRLRVDSTTVRRWIINGMLEAVILPHQGKRLSYRVRQQTLDQLLTAQGPLVVQRSNTQE